MRIALCHVLNVIPFLVCFCFSPVGSGVEVSNEFDIKIDHTEDQYLSIDEQVKKENLGYRFIWLSTTRQAAPPLNL
jgi:hypothetical protein